MTKETYMYDKRDFLVRQKRPTCMTKETYLYDERDLLVRQKRRTCTTKETYLCDALPHLVGAAHCTPEFVGARVARVLTKFVDVR